MPTLYPLHSCLIGIKMTQEGKVLERINIVAKMALERENGRNKGLTILTIGNG